MNYQVGNNNQTFKNNIFENTGIAGNGAVGKESRGNGFLNGNDVGDLLACKLIKGGKEPILDVNGVQIKTRAAKELENAKEGDTIFLKVQQADKNQVSLKIVGTSSPEMPNMMTAATGAEVLQNTEQFSEMIKENLDGALDEKTAKENQKEILRSIAPEEIAKLRMMQIDVTNATLSDLLGMVITIRSNEHQDEVNEQLEDIVKQTMDKLHDSIGDGKQQIVSDEQIIYMVKNEMELTIENLELSKNSVNEDSPSQVLPLNNQVWNDIYPQVSGIIEAMGVSVTEQNLSAAQFMLKYELPVTVDSLRLYMSAQALNQRGLQDAQIEANIKEQIALGNLPSQAKVIGSTLHERAAQLVEKVHAVTPQAVDSAVIKGKPLSISFLYNSSMLSIDVARLKMPINKGVEGASLSLSGAGQEADKSGTVLSTNPAAVTGRRQLEEIRLAMTVEAAVRLIKQDINIDARPLSEIVELLKTEENNYYENVVSAHDLHDIPEGVDLLKETLKETDSLKTLPEYALGEMVKRPSVTVGGLYESAVHIKTVLAGEAYETMMTRPRSDMGDSIKDAFQNIDAILEDMDMDRNEENQRAVRILAYNQMELNEINIAGIKSADAKVQQMFETLTPQIVLNLIRENKNPLNMTIDGLNEEIMQQKEVLGITDEQRFSEFLYQMDKSNAITDAERQSFIGIYRLLDKIEKSHGKDIGAVVRNGQKITLNNLFSADKSRKARGMDIAVDKAFGERENVDALEGSILSQIKTAYNQTLTGSILRHVRPETFKSLQELDYMDMSFEELNAIMKAGDNGQGEHELIEELSWNLQEALTHVEDVEAMLEANDMPKTVTNILAAQQVMYGENGIYGMVRNIKRNLSKEKRDIITDKESKILENLESKSDVIYGLENIRSALSDAVHEKEAEGTITSMDIQALKYLNAGMPIAMRAVEEEVFRIPLVVGEEVSIMKVSVLQDGSKAGEITATLDTQQFGRLEAFIHVEGNQIEGSVITEEESGQKKLEANELTFRSAFAKAGMEARDLRLDGTKPEQYGYGVEKGEVATTKLYQVAKQLLTAIKLTGIAADN